MNRSFTGPISERATSVIDGVPRCHRRGGFRIMGDCPEVLGSLLAENSSRINNGLPSIESLEEPRDRMP
jgi:hypothetical protein